VSAVSLNIIVNENGKINKSVYITISYMKMQVESASEMSEVLNMFHKTIDFSSIYV
jgi:hypothetical protein